MNERHALVIHAHPDPGSYSAALRDAAMRGLERTGRSVAVVDLYAEGFAAAMSRQERLDYEGDQPISDEQVRRSADLLARSDVLAFVYPTWWWGLPAVVKGWMERVLVPGVGFVFDEGTGRVRPGMPQVRRMVGVTTTGSPRWTFALAGNAGRRVIHRSVMLNAGWRCRPVWLALHDIDRAGVQDRERFLDRVETRMARL